MRSPVTSSVEPVLALGLAGEAAVAAQRGLLEDRVRREDADPGPNGEGERVGRPGVDLDRPAVALEHGSGRGRSRRPAR